MGGTATDARLGSQAQARPSASVRPKGLCATRGVELAADLASRLTHEALAALASAEVAAAPLKGVLLLARWPELRGRRNLLDVDLLVSPDDFSRAEIALGALGFEATSRTNRGATLETTAWPMSIDLHHHLFSPHLFAMPTHAVLARATRDEGMFGLAVPCLDDRDLFAHVVGHAVKSRIPPDTPYVVDDLSWLLGALDIDAARYAAHLRLAKMHRAAGYVLSAPALRDRSDARDLVMALRLTAADRAAIAAALAKPTAYWAPHVLNGTLPRGLRSFSAQVPEAVTWRAHRWRARWA